MDKTWQKIKKNPDLLKNYFVREKVIQTIRDFFKKEGFHEVFTPVMVPVPSIEPNLEVFETQLRTSTGKQKRAFLISSPEYAHKRLLAAGVGSLFEITHSFRNEEEVSRLHSPEFTILEWYRVNADYKDTMKDFEHLFLEIVGKEKMVYQGQEYDLSLPWPRITVAEAFEKFAGIDIETLLSEEKLLNAGRAKGYVVEPADAKALADKENTTWEQMFYQIFLNEIETKIRDSHKPTFIYDYPLAQASLSRPKKEDPRFAERFEVFLAGVELGNCFSELTDAEAQHKRFEADLAERKKLGKTDFPIDEDFVDALKSGMPMSSGIAVGVDRLVMLAADVPNVSDTIFFSDNELFDL
ncbi:MAG: EF-P lysine aminoacylase GenX [Candidatus Woesebacteria bacterium]|nr:MAG: EF-P lysine aminoacylase GenX [Candidatus Woesebacteria bacterium]